MDYQNKIENKNTLYVINVCEASGKRSCDTEKPNKEKKLLEKDLSSFLIEEKMLKANRKFKNRTGGDRFSSLS